MKYFVESKFYDSGKVRTEILNEEEAKEKGYVGGYQIDCTAYDLYVDEFNTLSEAKAFALGSYLHNKI